MGVISADVMDLVPAEPLKAHPDVGLHIADEMAEVDLAVGVGQGVGDEDATHGGSQRFKTGRELCHPLDGGRFDWHGVKALARP
ncbi:hypothetical protein [Polycyclovorans algicola]|uniref:hypothetical protein n=1 Tax=Polycyclovorans algicola TaxID=616992 RepID=UPI001F42CF30|nr:hypothetical protein [Polycyclovorans algicola]